MKSLGLLLLFLFTFTSLMAVEVSTRISPNRPVKGEPFIMLIKVAGVEGKKLEPFISFNPGRVVVRDRTVEVKGPHFIHKKGKAILARDYYFKYEMVVESNGSYSIRNIRVEHGQQTIKGRNISFLARAAAPRLQDIFLMAKLSQNESMVGEGVTVDYYLYYRQLQLGEMDIKKFPKLKKFIKRFHPQKAGKHERIAHQGVAYNRILKYSARLFAQKSGRLMIDPLHMRVKYRPLTGYGYKRSVTKTLISPRVYLEVTPPISSSSAEPFSGLVGAHQAKIIVNGSKLRVGDNIDVTLIVNVEGSLEQFDSPEVYRSSKLEQFDTKTEFREENSVSATKLFHYTFLARETGEIGGENIKINYYLPQTGELRSMSVTAPLLQVLPSTAVIKKEAAPTKPDVLREKKNEKIKSAPKGVMAPIFKQSLAGGNRQWLFSMVNIILGLLLIWQLSLWVISLVRNKRHRTRRDELLLLAKKGDVNYSLLYQLLIQLSPRGGECNSTSIGQVINQSPLSDSAKTYFKSTMEQLEDQEFYGLNQGQMLLDNRFFKELVNQVEDYSGVNNEDSTARE